MSDEADKRPLRRKIRRLGASRRVGPAFSALAAFPTHSTAGSS